MATGKIIKNEAIFQNGAYSHNTLICTGYVTSGGTLLVIQIVLPRNASGKTISNFAVTDNSQIRVSAGGYVSPTTAQFTGELQNLGNAIAVVFSKTNGWGITNNSLVGGRIGVSFTVSD